MRQKKKINFRFIGFCFVFVLFCLALFSFLFQLRRPVCHSSIQFSFKIKIENWCQFWIFVIFYHKKYESAKSKIWTFFPFDKILKHNSYFYFNNKEKNKTERQFCFSGILWHGLLFMFRQKCKNWKLKITFSAKTLKIVDRTNQEGGRGVYSHGNFFAPSALSPDPLPSMWIFFLFCFVLFFFLSLSPSLPSHATLFWKGGSGK